MKLKHLSVLVLASAVALPVWSAQDVMIRGVYKKTTFGSAVAFAKDMNGDGLDEIVVGTPTADRIVIGLKTVKNTGSVRVYSPANNNALLFEVFGDRPGDQFGKALLNVGDINGDGFGDFAVGAPGADDKTKPAKPNAGRVVVYSGKDGSVLFSRYGENKGDGLGFSLALLNDFDGAVDDGIAHADILAGAPTATVVDSVTNKKLKKAGKLVVLSGFDGHVLLTTSGEQAGERMGFAVTGIDDQNGDGKMDIAGGAPYWLEVYVWQSSFGPITEKKKESGLVVVYSGADGNEIARRTGEEHQVGAHFGWALVNMGDQNGDGLSEIGVGAPGELLGTGGGGHTKGRVYYVTAKQEFPGYSTVTHRIVFGAPGSAYWGYSLANAGDMNQDGRADVVASAPYTPKRVDWDSGGVVGALPIGKNYWGYDVVVGGPVSYGSDFTVGSPSWFDRFGESLACCGHTRADSGTPEVLIGAPLFGEKGNKTGGVFVVDFTFIP